MLAGMAGIIIIFDQWTKALVRSTLPIGEMWSPWPWLAPIPRIVNWNNTGAAFGFFQGYNGVLILLAIIVSIVIIYYFPRVTSDDWVMRVALGLQLGGALGNLIDRLALGRVTDFISVGSFAVFNVADSSITIGVIVLILSVWYKEQKGKRKGSIQPVLTSDEKVLNDKQIQGEGDRFE